MTPFVDREIWISSLDQAAVVRQDGHYSVSPGHCLIVPRRAVSTVWEMTEEEWMQCIRLLCSQKSRIDQQHRPDGYNVGINCGLAAGQTVFHAHIHLIPRYLGDHPDPRGGVRAVIPGKAMY